VIAELGDRLNLDHVGVSGLSLRDIAATARNDNPHVIRPTGDPLMAEGGLVILHGNLAPRGAVIKPGAATPELLQHRGRAVCFGSIEDFHARVDDPDLDIDASCVMVLKGCGPRGYPGMPEVGNMPLPRKLLEAGVRDMVRISDARMSGTAFGTVVLHCAPEAHVGGPLALVRDGDIIALDTANATLTLEVSDAELATRAAAWVPTPPAYDRGWYKLYVDHVLQADTGADLDFLVGKSGSTVTRESH
jgi:dihydroxy-acid dehydratase